MQQNRLNYPSTNLAVEGLRYAANEETNGTGDSPAAAKIVMAN